MRRGPISSRAHHAPPRAVREGWAQRRRGSILFVEEASFVEGADGLNRVGLFGLLVRAVALDAGKPQGEPAGIMRARLDVVERDLDHEPGLDVNRVRVV